MAVFFRSREPDGGFEVAEYRQISRSDPEAAAATRRSHQPEIKHLQVVLLSFGLLCVLQASLNIALRLSPATQPGTQPGPQPGPLPGTLPGTEEGTQDETQEEHSCPRGWIPSSSSCYYVSSQRESWDGARQDCRARGGDLVIINSQQEQDFLGGLVVAAWVGMTDRGTEGVWMWVDGTPVDKEWLRWAPGQPDDAYGGEDCGDLRVMRSFMGLNDFDCGFPAPWICEKNINPV